MKSDEDFPKRADAAAKRRGRDFKCRACKHDYYLQNQSRMAAQTRAANIRRRYGLEASEYDALIANGCSVCGTHDSRIVLDHSHITGEVRGPLCDRCNLLLGRVEADKELLVALAAYLEKHS